MALAQDLPRRIVDASPSWGKQGAGIQNLTDVGGILFFSAWDATHGDELWRSDGTTAGTYRVKDIMPGRGSSFPRQLVAVGTTLFFLAHDEETGHQIWCSDGSEAGTRRVKVMSDGSSETRPRNLTAAAGKLFFTMPAGPASSGETLWCSDGTLEGTREVPVEDLPHGQPASLGNFIEFDSSLFFTNGPNLLMRSDGTQEGTQPVAWLTSIYNRGPDSMSVAGGLLYFNVTTPKLNPAVVVTETWQSDGTMAGTRIADFWDERLASNNVQRLSVAGDRLFLHVSDDAGSLKTWLTDGSAAALVMLSDGSSPSTGVDIDAVGAHGAGVVYRGESRRQGKELWITDGSVEGQRLFKDIAPGKTGSDPGEFTASGENLFFRASRPREGSELWMLSADGRAKPVADVRPGAKGSFPSGLVHSGGALFWVADDGRNGAQLWRTDGTRKGTRRLTTLAGWEWSPELFAGSRRSAGREGVFYFNAIGETGGEDLWRSDGTTAGTWQLPLKDKSAKGTFPDNFTVAENRVFFHALDHKRGEDLWMTDGSPKGTVVPFRLDEEARSAGWTPSVLGQLGGSVIMTERSEGPRLDLLRLDAGATDARKVTPGESSPGSPGEVIVFTRQDLEGGYEPWVSDGTLEGTGRLKDIEPGTASSNPQWLAGAGAKTYFTATTRRHGHELWVTDGTADGTLMVKDIKPGPNGSLISQAYPLGDKVLFIADSEYLGGMGSHRLWISDGTASGTVALASSLLPGFFNGPGQESPDFAAVGDRVVFVASSYAYNAELWVTDGTPAGTGFLKEIRPGDQTSGPQWLTSTGNAVYFSADDGRHGRELWRTDGTPEGTVMVLDLSGDGESSNPWGLTYTGGKLFFLAWTIGSGTVPYVIDRP